MKNEELNRVNGSYRAHGAYGSYGAKCLFLLALLVLAGCSSDDEVETYEPKQTMKVLPVTAPFYEVQPITRGYLPDGYVAWAGLSSATNPTLANIGVFMVPDRANPSGDYIYENSEGGYPLRPDSWSSTITVEDGKTYYMYGFMPREAAQSGTIEPLTGANTSGGDKGYAAGAIIHLKNFATLTAADVCVISGIRKATTSEATNLAPESDVKLGTFSYTGGAEGTNSVFVLLRHVYSALHFRAIIDPEYHKLRTIKFTKVELIAKDIAETIDLDITITAKADGTDPVTNVDYIDNSSGSGDHSITVFPWYDGQPPYELREEEPNKFLACFAPASCNSFVIRCHYNVYDRYGNLTRENCVAENKINSTLIHELTNIVPGDAYTFTCAVKPTYLYVLSESDLDNPTFEITVD